MEKSFSKVQEKILKLQEIRYLNDKQNENIDLRS